MWPGGLDARYRAALTVPHTASMRVDVTDNNGVVILPDIAFSAGQVQATLQSRVARVLNLTVDRSLFPLTPGGQADPGGFLAPLGNRIKAYRGIRYGDGTVWPPPYGFPVFYGAIESLALRKTGDLALVANDLANEIVTGPFVTPMNSIPTNSVQLEFQRLVLDQIPNAEFGTSDAIRLAVGQLTWATDRAKALDDISAGSGAIWYPLADGSFVQRLNPWTKPGQLPVATLADGPGGMASDWTVNFTRTGVANVAVYISDRQDGSASVRSVATDVDPTSPTFVRGKFGRHPIITQNQGGLTQGQANTAASTTLHSSQALGLVWSPLSIVPDASLELGDLLAVSADGIDTQQVVTGFTVPLRETGQMPVTVRQYQPLIVGA
jgi:hypothetical protein